MKKRIFALVIMAVLALGVTACGKESEGNLVFDVPEGFVYDEAAACYVGPNYPNELANINYYSQENDGSFKTVTEANIEAALEDGLSEGFGEDVDITLTRWEETEVDGYEAIVYTCEYTYAGLGFEQTQIAINGTDYFHYVTFSDFADSAYADDFEACMKAMTFEPAE